jgi:thiamine-phosphate pyrophosphorylase
LAAPAAEKTPEALVRKISQVASAGVDWLQIREKDLTGKEITRLTREALRFAKEATASCNRSVRIVVNERLDVAIAERAGGLHLGQDGIGVPEARRLIRTVQIDGRLGDDFIVGTSCHSLGAARAAEREGADYIFFGPVFATPSKQAFGPPQGVKRLAEVCDTVNIPVLAIGGITAETAAECLAAGAAGIAAIRLFQETMNPSAVLSQIRQISK